MMGGVGVSGGGGGGGGVRNDYGIVDTVDMGQIPGILSPAPANLPGISAAMFSPTTEMNEWMMNPFNTSFLPSPSTLFLLNAPMVSPSPPPFGELFNFDS